MHERAVSGLCLLLTAALLVAGEARAQWWVDAGIGGAGEDAVASRAGTNSAVLGIRRDGTSWLQASAGVPLDSSAAWGSLALGTQVSRPGRITLGGMAIAQAFGYASTSTAAEGWGAIAELGPVIEHTRGALEFELQSSLLGIWRDELGSTTSRLLHSSTFRLSVVSATTRAEGAAQYVAAEGTLFPFLRGSLTQDFGRAGWWGGIGKWLSDGIDEPEWSIGGYANVRPRLQLHASFRQETNDPIYETPRRRIWSAGASVGLTRRAAGAEPVPVHRFDQPITVRIPRGDEPVPPALAGDFNGWQPTTMTADGRWWTITFFLAPGVYRYSFRDADGQWFLPASIPYRVDDGFGGENGVLVVR
jgi:hypothetical protein